MQRKTMFLSLIIPGPDYPGKQLGVFMQPLVDALHHSWYFSDVDIRPGSAEKFLDESLVALLHA